MYVATVDEPLSYDVGFNTTQFSYKCVHPIHTNVYSIQMFVATLQSIVPRVFTLLIFIHLF